MSSNEFLVQFSNTIMSRLADYFAVIGYDHVKQERGKSVGVLIQRFPEKDWPDTPYTEGIEWFCQPRGWHLSIEKQEPKFFVSVLTDIDANRHYCASLSFHEPFLSNSNKPSDEDDEDIDVKNDSQHLGLRHYCYAPKCLVIISRVDCVEIFRNCLGIIYTVYNEDIEVPLETLVGNILGCIQIPPAGGPQIRFSIGAGDRQSYQPPQNTSIPITQTCVHFLFKQLGIRNTLVIFCAIMTEHKILVYSRSYTRLSDSCRALVALMFPFRYNHIFIPLLPVDLHEVLSTPTPFVIGIDSFSKNEFSDLTDVIFVDLDGGTIDIPDNVTIPQMPKALQADVEESLFEILQPDLAYADYAFAPASYRISQPLMIDKEIRAVFLRMFASLFQGYRSCLTIIRIFPKLVITFHKASFLGERSLNDCDFCLKLLDCMFFTNFITERGCPWRPADLWDELYNNYGNLSDMEMSSESLRLKHIQELAQQLYLNENPCLQCSSEKIPIPNEQSSMISEREFPVLEAAAVQTVLENGLTRNDLKQRLLYLKPPKSVHIIMGPKIKSIAENQNLLINSTRKLDVLRNCINLIFDNKIADAKKTIHAVSRVLKSKSARLTLCDELTKHVTGNKAILEHQQFDLIVRLINCALQYNPVNDDTGFAYALLPLATTFCRKLCTGVIQFAYTCIQDHSVWQNQQFWESSFYQDVQKDIKSLYVSRLNVIYNNNYHYKDFEQLTALELATEQMKIADNLPDDAKRELATTEESTLYSQAIHYANRMVSLMIPLDVGTKLQKSSHALDDERLSATNSVAESDSVDVESIFSEHVSYESGMAVIRTISRFIEKICVEGGVSNEHIKSLNQMIPGVVHMHIETLEAVHRESKRLPIIPKTKISIPTIINGEKFEMEGLRAYLLNDGREDYLSCTEMLPAEGAIFLTNYRVIFQGVPCDSEVAGHRVIRSFPITSLTKEKRITLQDMSQEGLQLRSCTFQLIKIAFDDEVKSKSIELFKKNLQRLRYPVHVFSHFAFSNQPVTQNDVVQKTKEKNSTLKRFAKKTLLRTAQKAGFKNKDKHQKFIFQNNEHFNNSNNTNNSISRNSNNIKYSTIANTPVTGAFSIENSVEFDDELNTTQTLTPNTSKTLERSLERKYVKDWRRLGLVDLPSSFKSNFTLFRITRINSIYLICKSYPSLFLVPKDIEDDCVRKLSKYYRNSRIPVVTWSYRKNKALLMRGASHLTKGVIDLLKNHSTSPNSNNETSFNEQEKYFQHIVNATRKLNNNHHVYENHIQSNMSLNTLHNSKSSLTPKFFNRFNYLQNKKTLRLNGDKCIKNTLQTKQFNNSSQNSNSTIATANEITSRPAVYIIGEKSQLKVLKSDTIDDLMFVPVEHFDVKETKTAFKKLMRACIPSSPPTASDSDSSFLEQIEQSGWLQQIQSILDISIMVVDKIDKEATSVAVCLEDGWDVTAQITSIVQLCLDGHYRTLEGFRHLIEKDWLAFGHKFNQRSNLTVNSQSSGFINVGFTPVFLQFLDCVYQIQRQFPTAFEFNEFYLRFLAYHSVSGRYRQFLFDNEFERYECGVLTVEDKFNSLVTHKTIEIGSSEEKNFDYSIFDFIEKQHSKSPIFYNFLFVPTKDDFMIMRPKSNIEFLEIWNYYLSENLSSYSGYDFDVDNLEENDRIQVITNGIDNLKLALPDEFTQLLQEINKLEEELGYMPHKWKILWDRLDVPMPLPPSSSRLAASALNDTINEDAISINSSSSTTRQLFRKKPSSQKRNFFHLRKK